MTDSSSSALVRLVITRNMPAVASGDTNHQTGDVVFFFTEAHALRILTEYDAGFQDAIFRLNRYRAAPRWIRRVGWRQFFAFQHRVNIFRLNVASFYQLFAGKANRFFFWLPLCDRGRCFPHPV